MKGEKDFKFWRNCWKEYCFQEIIQYVLIPSPPPQSLKHSSYFVPTRFYKGFPISMFLLFTSHHDLLTEILFSWGEPFWSLPCFSSSQSSDHHYHHYHYRHHHYYQQYHYHHQHHHHHHPEKQSRRTWITNLCYFSPTANLVLILVKMCFYAKISRATLSSGVFTLILGVFKRFSCANFYVFCIFVSIIVIIILSIITASLIPLLCARYSSLEIAQFLSQNLASSHQ